MEMTTNQAKDMNRNPTGKGGFAERKGDISPGGWKKENTISYQYNRFMNMTRKELRAFDKLPDDEKTMAMQIAFARVVVAASSKGLSDAKEIADRTEGRAYQSMDITSAGEKLEGLIIIQDKDE